MLDSTGMLLERLILTRINDHLDSIGLRSPNQYGFRRGRSTEDAIKRLLVTAHGVAVSLDVRNAFNTAPWRRIDAALREKKVPSYLIRLIRFYLQDRSILVGHSPPAKYHVRRSSGLGPRTSTLEPHFLS